MSPIARRLYGATHAPASVVANTTVDFTASLDGTTLSTLSIGSCISTYSDGGVNVINGAANAAAWQTKLSELGALTYRIPLAWNNGTPGSSAGGARSYGNAAAYVTAIKNIGGTPYIAVGGTTGDNDILANDAANLVHYFNDNGGQNGGPVTHWIIGNEPDNGFGVTNYIQGGNGCDGFNAIAAAMRAASSTSLSIAGPSFVTWASYKYQDYRDFLDACGSQLDTIDFHKYGDGQHYDNIPRTTQYGDAAGWFQTEIQNRSATADRVAIQCGEFNYNPSYNSWPDTFYTSRNTVHTASVIGQLLNHGARAYQYSDCNGPLGLISDGTGNNGQPSGQHVPLPAYYGIKVWTGGNLFQTPTGNMVACSTSLSNIEVYASSLQKNIILINKSETTAQTAVIVTQGASSGSATVWQTTQGMDYTNFASGSQFTDPTNIQNGSLNGGLISVNLPALTVTTITIS